MQSNLYHVTDKGNLENGHIRQVIVEWGGYCKTFDWIKVKNSILFYSVAICHNKCGRSTT